MGGMGMNANMLKQAQKMQQDMMRMQQELQEKCTRPPPAAGGDCHCDRQAGAEGAGDRS